MIIVSTSLGVVIKFKNDDERKRIAQQMLDMPDGMTCYAYYDESISEKEITEFMKKVKESNVHL